MDEDECLSIILSMGFPNIEEIKKALRFAKNDVNEAVAILTNEQPLNVDDLSVDIDMKDVSRRGGGTASSSTQSDGKMNPDGETEESREDEGKGMEFPTHNLYELEQRVFQDNWSIPYKREESLGRCLVSATNLARENLMEADDNCKKFIDRVMPEAFRKLLTSSATHRWQAEIQEGIYNMLELYIDLVITRLQHDPVPISLLNILATAFDLKNGWNSKNKDQAAKGRWSDGAGGGRNPVKDWAKPLLASESFSRDQYGWLCDLINQFGDLDGFELVFNCVCRDDVSARSMAALLHPLANCAELLVKENVAPFLTPCMEKAFRYVEKIDEADLKSKEVTAVSDLLSALKLLCNQFCPEEVKNCDRLRLSTICRMLQTPLFSSKMNALKEVSRLIEESEQHSSNSTSTFSGGKKNNAMLHIGVDEVVEWMADNKVLTIALEGNIDQVQYTDRIKSIVEFLGSRLSLEELTKMWNLQDSPNPHVMDNVHAIMSSAASKFSLAQFEHLTGLIKEKWGKSNDRVREKLLVFIGQMGRDAKQLKSTQAILQLLWDVSHLDSLPKHLVERALSEQLNILTDMSLNKDSNRKSYINRCVEDIKADGICVLPAVNHLHMICKSYTKGTTIYSKADKATLGNLNEQHGIVKLLCNSLKQAHKLAERCCCSISAQPLKPDTIIDGRYTHEEYVRGHLDLMKFFLKEGDLYLSWGRCQEIWETLVANPQAITFDRDLCFEWFENCLSDLENDTQREFFLKMLLQVPPSNLTIKGFDCFKAYFESVNHTEGKLRKGSSPPYTVESMDLTGLEFLWTLITDCAREDIADLAIDYFLQKSYLSVNAKLKKESVKLHQKFIESCYERLEQVFSPKDQKRDDAQEGCEIEMSVTGDPVENQPDLIARKVKTEVSSVFKVSSSFSDDSTKCQKMQRIRRLLLLAERYVSTIEATHPSNRSILPHAAMFRGRPLRIKIIYDTKKEEFTIESHTNEMVCDVKNRLGDLLKQPVDQLNVQCDDVTLGSNKDRCLVGFIGSHEGQTWVVKSQGMATTASSSSTALVVYDEGAKDFGSSAECSSASAARHGVMNEQEKTLPGVVMASGGRYFTMLYQLASLNDSRILQGIRRLIHLIPTDPSVSDALDAISYHSTPQPLASADASPKLSPRSKKVIPNNLEDAKKQLAELFDASAEGMSAFRVLYNLEVLSGKLLPTKQEPVPKFSNDFLEAGGLRVILDVFQHDALPIDVNCDVRQSIYLVALQLSCYLLCGEVVGQHQHLHHQSGPPASPIPKPNPLTSPVMKPTPPKKSALDATAAMSSVGKSPVVVSSSRVVQTMLEKEFSDVVSCLMRIVWAAAAGNLQLASSCLPNPVANDQQSSSSRFYVCRRSSHSSTGSSGSTGSDGASGVSANHIAESLHPGVCVQQSFVHPGDCQIAGEALQLLVTCLQLRSNNISLFYNLPLVHDFVIDTVLGSPSEIVRRRACTEFQRLSKIRLTARALNLDGESSDPKASHRLLTPKQFLTKTILKAPVPLWMPSCKARGISHAILAQCTEYFDLRSYLLGEMSLREQECQGVSSKQMIEDELNFLHNYTPCHRPIDCTLLAGHLRLVEALLLCEGVDKVAVGANLIKELLNVYLFPSSRLIADGALSNGNLVSIDLTEARNINPKCDTSDSRVAAYSLLVELARNSPENTTLIVEELIRMHHTYNESLSKEFEYEPPIERRALCNFVGLKNAGATCYMNSVLQQLYNVPNISDQVLNVEMDSVDEETVFYQLQNVFGHLLESKLQHYIPEKFWRCFRLFGQPVNVREQQDAFEFFTQIVDQVDEHLVAQGKSKIFSRHFEGVFSDQKICQGCPHRYEREQTFMALNLTVKSNNLQESLDQFVKGELLEGDNAYFCEKCHEKRNAIKRMCIRTLPQTLVIQLKRFHYDWETNRALKFDDFFQFPWTIDMGPYTTEGIQRAESDPISAAAIAAAISEKESTSSSSGGGDTPLAYRKVSFSSSFSRNNPDLHYPYELVGIVVHSGQANAGHYYSYIKERRGHSLTNRNKNRWFKFNDTTVEEFEMTDEKMMNECFGGTYKVKKTGVAPNLPEERQRYWNAYMLFYESRVEKKSTKTTRRSLSHSQHLQRGAMSQRKISMPVGPTMSAAESPAPKESLSQLSDLLEKSEKKSLFASRMPSAIERGIQEENLRFLQNRDVFCEDYYQFICQLINANRGFTPPPPPRLFEVRGSNPAPPPTLSSPTSSSSVLAIESVRLAVHFLLNSYYHVKKRDRQVQNEILGHVEDIIEKNRSACEWLLHYLADDGLQYMRTLLLECDAREVRVNFSNMIERTFHYYKQFNGETESDDVNLILATLVALIDKDVANNCKSSGQFFWILAKFAKMGVRQCQQLFQLNSFRNIIKFLLNVEPEPEEDESTLLGRQRRWTVSQSREFGELHSALAHLILACDTRPHRTCASENGEDMEAKLPAARVYPPTDSQLLPMPTPVSSVLYGPLSTLYIREAVCACREVTVSIAPIVDALVQVSYCCQKFSKILVEEMMRQFNNVSSGELKNLSTLLVDILVLSDPLQQERLKFVIDGDQSLKIDGLLTVVKNNQTADSCRSYQCIKILVNAANKSPAVKDRLLLDSARWQWAVNWLKNKMGSGDNGTQSSNYWNSSTSLSPTSTSDVVSNEDPSTRTFHRTTSALMTLEDANAILAEFDRPSPTCEDQMDTGGDNGNVTLGNEDNDDDDMPDLQQMVTSSDLNNSKDN